ncbi:hypothetical protein G5714_014197 [Onychostoma macrolepis]|uniref:Uncharacterized protein n=1 Tax=Onychostoma macrolepis TaxID=369639 RepID=A0A7J6CCM4_9TELE|nr:hypothetical protein G5714_014197 [Onychostoma macrolepis]
MRQLGPSFEQVVMMDSSVRTGGPVDKSSMRQNKRAACMLWEIHSVLRCTADWRLWAYELRGLDIDSIMLVMGAYCSECLRITPQFPPKRTSVCFRHALWSALLQVKTFKAHLPHAATLHIACRLPARNKMAATVRI